MSKLKWDQDGERFFEFGDKFGVLYPKTGSSSDPYPKGYAWNGLTAVSESPEGAEANDLYADDKKYGSLRSAETLGFTIEAYTYPDQFAECDGSVQAMKAGTGSTSTATGVYVTQQPRKAFGFCYRTQIGNDESDAMGYKLHLLYGCTASPSERSYETINDSPDAITFSWECDTVPVEVTGFDKPTSELIIDSRTCPEAALTAIEDVLYGTDPEGSDQGTDARLPLPDEVISTIKNAITA